MVSTKIVSDEATTQVNFDTSLSNFEETRKNHQYRILEKCNLRSHVTLILRFAAMKKLLSVLTHPADSERRYLCDNFSEAGAAHPVGSLPVSTFV